MTVRIETTPAVNIRCDGQTLIADITIQTEGFAIPHVTESSYLNVYIGGSHDIGCVHRNGNFDFEVVDINIDYDLPECEPHRCSENCIFSLPLGASPGCYDTDWTRDAFIDGWDGVCDYLDLNVAFCDEIFDMGLPEDMCCACNGATHTKGSPVGTGPSVYYDDRRELRRIETIEGACATDCSGALILSYSRLTSIKPGTLTDLPLVNQISLHVNELTTIPPGLVDGSTALSYINLHDNPLTSIAEGAFVRDLSGGGGGGGSGGYQPFGLGSLGVWISSDSSFDGCVDFNDRLDILIYDYRINGYLRECDPNFYRCEHTYSYRTL